MSNEVRVNLSMSAVKGSFKAERTHTYSYDHASVSNASNAGTIAFTTATVTVDFSAIAVEDCMMINLSTANSVKFGPKDPGGPSIVDFITLKPGRGNFISVSTGVTFKARTVSGTADVQFVSLNRTT